MILTTIQINDIVYFLLKNIDYIYSKNDILNLYFMQNKNSDITIYECQFYLTRIDIFRTLEQIFFWSQYVPFTQEFLLFTSIYYIFKDKFKYIKNLLIIKNTKEVFHFVRQLYYRNTVGYYNEYDELNRLTNIIFISEDCHNNHEIRYEYDSSGNRTRKIIF